MPKETRQRQETPGQIRADISISQKICRFSTYLVVLSQWLLFTESSSELSSGRGMGWNRKSDRTVKAGSAMNSPVISTFCINAN